MKKETQLALAIKSRIARAQQPYDSVRAVKQTLDETIERVRAILALPTTNDSECENVAGLLACALADSQYADAWAFNDAVWAERRDVYDSVELNPSFIELWLS